MVNGTATPDLRIDILPVRREEFLGWMSEVNALYDQKNEVIEQIKPNVYAMHNIPPGQEPSLDPIDEYLEICDQITLRAKAVPAYAQCERKLQDLEKTYEAKTNAFFKEIITKFLENLPKLTNGQVTSVEIGRKQSYNYPLEKLPDNYEFQVSNGGEIQISLGSTSYWCNFFKQGNFGELETDLRKLFGNNYIAALKFSPIGITFDYGGAEEGYELFRPFFEEKYRDSLISPLK